MNDATRNGSDKKLSYLTDTQFEVTQNDATERAFENEYWDHKEDGIYVDVVNGDPLFASVHKYDSGSGWPSFFQALEPENIIEFEDNSGGLARIEVRSHDANSHLGHVFPDGSEPTGHRYCINSAALRFVHRNELKSQGYEKYVELFNVKPNVPNSDKNE